MLKNNQMLEIVNSPFGVPDAGGPGPPMAVTALPPPMPVADLPLTWPPFAPPPPTVVVGPMPLAAPCAVVRPFTEGSYLRIGVEIYHLPRKKNILALE